MDTEFINPVASVLVFVTGRPSRMKGNTTNLMEGRRQVGKPSDPVDLPYLRQIMMIKEKMTMCSCVEQKGLRKMNFDRTVYSLRSAAPVL